MQSPKARRTIRFQESGLVDSLGATQTIPYEVLKGECLKHVELLSITKIVSTSFVNLFGLPLYVPRCRESELFLKLEKDIRESPEYLEEYKRVHDIRDKIRVEIESERMGRIDRSPYYQAKDRIDKLQYYRRKHTC